MQAEQGRQPQVGLADTVSVVLVVLVVLVAKEGSVALVLLGQTRPVVAVAFVHLRQQQDLPLVPQVVPPVLLLALMAANLVLEVPLVALVALDLADLLGFRLIIGRNDIRRCLNGTS
jgi:hypothetical protein